MTPPDFTGQDPDAGDARDEHLAERARQRSAEELGVAAGRRLAAAAAGGATEEELAELADELGDDAADELELAHTPTELRREALQRRADLPRACRAGVALHHDRDVTPADPPETSCDWGECGEESVGWRWSEADARWLPVCVAHASSKPGPPAAFTVTDEEHRHPTADLAAIAAAAGGAIVTGTTAKRPLGDLARERLRTFVEAMLDPMTPGDACDVATAIHELSDALEELDAIDGRTILERDVLERWADAIAELLELVGEPLAAGAPREQFGSWLRAREVLNELDCRIDETQLRRELRLDDGGLWRRALNAEDDLLHARQNLDAERRHHVTDAQRVRSAEAERRARALGLVKDLQAEGHKTPRELYAELEEVLSDDD